ncbi:carbohydrate-binding family 9-like protein [Dyadobacter sp. Leaf189]|uniref:carbohydrate-binding family 9-like protein n=1 Tax=Dyadobacter sp. Leaf189 TaxID=1736295 RepID=UPI000A991A0C|nr:carbohydrate-binding family 9-like protein [Dyadobacter sp. Leaf189]
MSGIPVTGFSTLLSRTCLSLFASVLPGFFQENLAQAPAQPKSYDCYQPDKKIVIDGKLNEGSWKKAAWTSLFEDIEGDKKPKPLQQTRAKMLWDKDYLYIAAVIEEEHIWAYQNRKDQIVYLENDFEVFIDPDGDTDNYYELEVNALNNIFDLFLPKTYRSGGKADIRWDIKGLLTAVSIDGTINNAADRDKRWTVEIAIPFTGLSTSQVTAVIPEDGSEWRINFSRVNWQHEVDSDGKYARKRDPATKKILPEYNWVWSPQGIINMHYPEYWGRLTFHAQQVSKAK